MDVRNQYTLPIGYKSGKLKIINAKFQKNVYKYTCECMCGKIIENITKSQLRYRTKTSCGCEGKTKKTKKIIEKSESIINLIQSKSWGSIREK